ncbi:MAG TPA: hypothetical protein VNZ53_06905 [Steroidobacteraceae bacterium]|jgi:hypothetical protein|nr:hypothetical protein [Steroidobacteraceae bacterium]
MIARYKIDWVHSGISIGLILACLATPHAAIAEFKVDPYATAHIEHDSNVFLVQNSEVQLAERGFSEMGDTDTKYVAGLHSAYLWSLQSLTGNFEVRRLNYFHFTDLDHNEYLGDLRFDWKLASVLDGVLELRQEHSAPSFASNNSIGLTLNTARYADAKVNLKIMPEWRLEAETDYSKLDAPLQAYPNFVDREVGTQLGIKYLGVANLAAGFTFAHIDGRFENAPVVGPYSQSSGEFKLNYLVSGLTKLNAGLGYTRRTQSGQEGTASAVTGEFGYNRQLTAKTALDVQLTRAVNSYVAAGGSEIDTSASLSLTWQATYKVGAGLYGTYTHSAFIGQAIPGSFANGRVDRSKDASLKVKYQAFRRLQFSGYLSSQRRNSVVGLYDFNDTIVGVEAQWHWKEM